MPPRTLLALELEDDEEDDEETEEGVTSAMEITCGGDKQWTRHTVRAVPRNGSFSFAPEAPS